MKYILKRENIMPPGLAILFLTVMLVLFTGTASAESQKVISEKNEYG